VGRIRLGSGLTILETSLSANAITVVSPSCTILSGKNMNVDVGTIKRSDLKGVGTTAGGKDLILSCSAAAGKCQGYANISTSFPERWPPAHSESRRAAERKDRLLLAKGVGIQVLKDGVRWNSTKNTASVRCASGNPLHHPASACAFLSICADHQYR
jgi:type 1 fimbria pilin